MKLNHWPFILLKRSKDDYFPPAIIPDTPEFEFAEKVFGEAAVLQAYKDNPVWANDIANQLYQLNQLTGMTWEAMQAHAIARPDNWITDLSAALAAALNPNPNLASGVIDGAISGGLNSNANGTTEAFEDFGSSALNTTGALVAGGSITQSAQDIASSLSGLTSGVGSAAADGAASAVIQGGASAVGSAVADGAAAVLLQGSTSVLGSAVADGAGSNVMGPLNPRDYANVRADELANDYNMSPAQEASLAQVFFKYPQITNEQIITFMENNPSTWARDLFVFEVAMEFNLTSLQSDQLMLILRANSGWSMSDLRAYMRSIDPSDYTEVLSQATAAVNLATENRMTVGETQNLTSAMVNNSLFNETNIQAFIDANPNSWRRVLEVHGYINSLPELTAAQKDALLNLSNESAEWTKGYIENLISTNATGWTSVVALEQFYIRNDMTEAQQTLVQNFMASDSTITLAVVQTYINAHAATWERDLVRWDIARDVADDNQFTLEQRNQVAAYMVRNHTITRATIDSAITTDKAGFLRDLIVFDVGEQFHFDAEQRTALDHVLRAYPTWTAADLKAYIAAHPTDWDDDLNQVGNTAILTDRHDLSTTQRDLLGAYLLGDYRVDVNALNTMIENDPDAFDDLMASVSEANSFATERSLGEAPREQVMRLMTSGPKFSEEQMEAFFTQHGTGWEVALRQFDASWLVATHLNLSAADRAIVEKLMLTDHRTTSSLANYIQQNPNTWRNDLKLSELFVRHQINDYDANQLKAFLVRHPEWTIEGVDQYIKENSATWKSHLRLNTAAVGVDQLAATHSLNEEDKTLLTTWMAANQRMTLAEIEALIAANPTGWKAVLAKVKEAIAFADTNHLSQDAKDAIIRINAADPDFKLSEISELMTQFPDTWLGVLGRVDAAVVIADMLNLSKDDYGLVKRGMTFFADLDFNGMTAFINLHGSAWKTKLQELIQVEIDKLNPIGDVVDGGIQVTTGSELTTARIQWTYGMSFNDFKALCATDQSLWVEQDFELVPAQMGYSGKIEALIPAITEKRMLPPTAAMMEAMFIDRYGSPLDKARGHLLGSYDHTEVISYGKDNSVTGPTQRLYADFGAIDASQTTGDSRNRDITWTGNFWDRLSGFTSEVNGTNYRDIPADMVKYLEGPMYLARQLSDLAKAANFSYENPSGDNAVQLGIYLDMLGLKDINHLFVKDGRYIDISTGKDLGAYEKDQPFGWSAMGKGWNDFLPHVMENGQVVLIPKWGSTSDAGIIAAVVAVVLVCTGVGAAAGAALFSSVGSAAVATGLGTGLVVGASNVAIQALAGEKVTFGSALRTIGTSMFVGGVTAGLGEYFNIASGPSAGFWSNVQYGAMGGAVNTVANVAFNGGSFSDLGQNMLVGAGSAALTYGITTGATGLGFDAQTANAIGRAGSTYIMSGGDTTQTLLSVLGSVLPQAGVAAPTVGMTASEQAAFLEANTSEPQGSVIYRTTNEDGSRIEGYTQYNTTTGIRERVDTVYNDDGTIFRQSITPITTIDPMNPTGNVLSVDSQPDANGVVTRSFGVNGSLGTVTIDANGQMTGRVLAGNSGLVDYSVDADGRQIERTTITDGTGRTNVYVQELDTRTVTTEIRVNGETRIIPITNTSDGFTTRALEGGRVEITYSDSNVVVLENGKPISGTVNTVNGVVTFEGQIVTTALHSGGNMVEDLVNQTRVTTVGTTVTTERPGFVTVERFQENGTKIQIDTNTSNNTQSVRVFGESFESARSTATANGLSRATLVLDDHQLMDYVAPNASQQTQLEASTANTPYRLEVDETTGVTIKNFGDKGSLVIGENGTAVGELRVNESTLVRYTVVDGVQQIERSVVSPTGVNTTLNYNSSTGAIQATIVNPTTGRTEVLEVTNTERFTTSINDSGQTVRHYSTGDVIFENNLPISGTVVNADGSRITYAAGGGFEIKRADGFTDFREADGRTRTEDPTGKVVRVMSGDGKSGMYIDPQGREVTFNERMQMVNDGKATAVTDLNAQRTVITDNQTGKIGTIIGGTRNEAFAEARRVNGPNGVFFWDENPRDNIPAKAYSTQTQQDIARANGVSDAEYVNFVRNNGGEQYGPNGSALQAYNWVQTGIAASDNIMANRATAALGNEGGMPGINQMVVNLRAQATGLAMGETKFFTGADGNVISVKHLGDNVFVADIGNNQNVTFRNQGSFVSFSSANGATYTRSAEGGQWSGTAAPTAANANTGSIWNGLMVLRDQVATAWSAAIETRQAQQPGGVAAMGFGDFLMTSAAVLGEKISGFATSVNEYTGGNSVENTRIFMGAAFNLAIESVAGVPEAFSKFNDPHATDVERAAAMLTLVGGVATVVGSGALVNAGLKGVSAVTSGGLLQAGRTGLQIVWEAAGGMGGSGGGTSHVGSFFRYEGTGLSYSGTGIGTVDNWLRGLDPSESNLNRFANVMGGGEWRAPVGLSNANQLDSLQGSANLNTGNINANVGTGSLSSGSVPFNFTNLSTNTLDFLPPGSLNPNLAVVIQGADGAHIVGMPTTNVYSVGQATYEVRLASGQVVQVNPNAVVGSLAEFKVANPNSPLGNPTTLTNNQNGMIVGVLGDGTLQLQVPQGRILNLDLDTSAGPNQSLTGSVTGQGSTTFIGANGTDGNVGTGNNPDAGTTPNSNTDRFLDGQNNLTGDAAVAANNLRDSMRNLNDWNSNFSGNSGVSQSSKNIFADQIVTDVVGSTRGFLDDANLSPEQAANLLTNVKNDLRAFVTANMDTVEGNRMLASLDDRLAGRDFSRHYTAADTTGSGPGGTGSTDVGAAQVSEILTGSETYRSIHLATPDLPSAVIQNIGNDIVRLSTVSNRAEFEVIGKGIVNQIDQLDRNLVSVSDVELLKTSIRMDYVNYAEKTFSPAEARAIISDLDLQLGFTPQAPSRVVDSTRGYLGTTGGTVMTPERIAFENSLDSLQNWHNGLRNSNSLNPIEKNLVAKNVIDEAIDSFKRFESSGNPNMSAADLERLKNRFIADLEDFIDDTMDAGSSGAAKTEMRTTINGQTNVIDSGSGSNSGSDDIFENAFSKSWDDIQIDTAIITNRQNLPGQQGAAFLKLETGEIGGQKVFIKTGSESLNSLRNNEISIMENEAHWYEVIDTLGVGPKFHGVSEVTINGVRHPQLVTEFVDGTHLQLNTITNYTGPNSASIRSQILEIGTKLDDAGIRAVDLQFRVTPEGRVVVIDPEDFTLHSEGPGLSSRALAEQYVAALDAQAARVGGDSNVGFDQTAINNSSTRNLIDDLKTDGAHTSAVGFSVKTGENPNSALGSRSTFGHASENINAADHYLKLGGEDYIYEAKIELNSIKGQMEEIISAIDSVPQSNAGFRNGVVDGSHIIHEHPNGTRIDIEARSDGSTIVKIEVSAADGKFHEISLTLRDLPNSNLDTVLNQLNTNLAADRLAAANMLARADVLLNRNDLNVLHDPTVNNGNTGNTGNTDNLDDDPYVGNMNHVDENVGQNIPSSATGLHFDNSLRGYNEARKENYYLSVYKNADGSEAGQIKYSINDGKLHIENMWANAEGQGIGTAMLTDIFNRNPHITSTIVDDLRFTNLDSYTSAYDAAIARGLSIPEAVRIGIEATPAYKFRERLGFTELEILPSHPNSPEFVMRKPEVSAQLSPFNTNDLQGQIWDAQYRGDMATANSLTANLSDDLQFGNLVGEPVSTNHLALKYTLESGVVGYWKPRIVNGEDLGAAELAAQTVDGILQSKYVPLTVERTINGVPGTMQLSIEGIDAYRIDKVLTPISSSVMQNRPAGSAFWSQLISNNDINPGNVLTSGGQSIFFDNGPSFRVSDSGLKENLFTDLVNNLNSQNADASDYQAFMPKRDVYENLVNTTPEQWSQALSAYLKPDQIELFLRNRSGLIDIIEELRLTHGDDIFPQGPMSTLMGAHHGGTSSLAGYSNGGLANVDLDQVPMTDDLYAQFIGNNGATSMDMNVNSATNALDPSAYQSSLSLTAYNTPIENTFSHSAFANGRLASGGGLSASAEAIRDAGQAFFRRDFNSAIDDLNGAQTELNNLRFAFDQVDSWDANSFRQINSNTQNEVREFSNSVSTVRISETDHGSRVSVEIAGTTSSPSHRLEFNLSEKNLSLQSVISTFQAEAKRLTPIINKMTSDAEDLAGIVRMENIIRATPVDAAANRIATDFHLNQNYMSGRIVNENIPGQGQAAFDASGNAVIRVRSDFADIEQVGDLQFVGLTPQSLSVIRHEINHVADVAESASAGGFSPALGAYRDANGKLVFFSEVRSEQTGLRGYYQGYIDSLALGEFETAAKILAESPVGLRELTDSIADWSNRWGAGLRAESDLVIRQTLKVDPLADAVNPGFTRYSYDVVDASGARLAMSVEVPTGTPESVIFRMIRHQHEAGVREVNSMADSLLSTETTVGLKDQVQLIVNHADSRGLSPIHTDYSKDYIPTSRNTGDHVMNMNVSGANGNAIATSNEDFLSLLLKTPERNIGTSVVDNADNTADLPQAKSLDEQFSDAQKHYQALALNRNSNPLDRLLARLEMNQLEQRQVAVAVQESDGSLFQSLLNKEFKPRENVSDSASASSGPTLTVEEAQQLSLKARQMVERGETSEIEILLSQSRAQKSAQEIVDELCREALGPSATEKLRIFEIKGILDSPNVSELQRLTDPNLIALDRELYGIERKYRPFNAEERQIFDAVSEIPADTTKLTSAELRYIEDVRKAVYGPQGKTLLFPSDVEAIEKVNDLLEQIGKNRSDVVTDAYAHLRTINGSSAVTQSIPSSVETEFKKQFSMTARSFHDGYSGKDFDVLSEMSRLVKQDPDRAVHDDLFTYVRRFYENSMITTSGNLRNNVAENIGVQFFHLRMQELVRIDDIRRLNANHAVPAQI